MLINLRSAIFFLVMVLNTLVFGLLLSLLGWLLPDRINAMLANNWGGTTIWWLKVICGLDYKVSGQQHLTGPPAVVMSKHQSAWETIALRVILPPYQAWVLKRELMFIPVFGWALAVFKPIAINRKAGTKAVKQIVIQGIEQLAMGRWIVIFPEGTRVAPGTRKRYGIGAGVLAEKTGAAVVPLAHNAGVFWGRRGLKKYPGTINVVIGEPISTEGKKAAQIMQEVEDWIEGQMELLPTSPRAKSGDDSAA